MSDPARPQSPSPVFRGAVQDAELLLAYASEHGREVDVETITAVVACKRIGEDRASPPDSQEHEVRFWRALERLTSAVSPVSLDALKAVLLPGPDRSLTGLLLARVFGVTRQVTQAGAAVRNMRVWAVLTLVVLLLCQTYWVIGATVTRDTPRLLEEVQRLLGEKKAREGQLGDKAAEDQKVQEYEARLADYAGGPLRVNYEILVSWNNVWQGAWARRQAAPESATAGDSPDYLLKKELQLAQFALASLQLYLLPLLFGLLGAITYILRTLANDIRTLTYSLDDEVALKLRMPMGALAGLVIASFVSPESAWGGGAAAPTGVMTAFRSLSPFALAFLSGYSVEVLFALLDRFIVAFTSAEPGRSAPRQRQGQKDKDEEDHPR